MGRSEKIDTFEHKGQSMSSFVEANQITEKKSRAMDTEEGRARRHLIDFYNNTVIDENLIKSLESHIENRDEFYEWQRKYDIEKVSLSKKLCLYLLAHKKKSEGTIKYWLLIPDKQTVASRFKEMVTRVWAVDIDFYNKYINPIKEETEND